MLCHRLSGSGNAMVCAQESPIRGWLLLVCTAGVNAYNDLGTVRQIQTLGARPEAPPVDVILQFILAVPHPNPRAVLLTRQKGRKVYPLIGCGASEFAALRLQSNRVELAP
jgi:hypothetical protein